MKKFAAGLLLLVVGVVCTACSTFNDYQTVEIANTDPTAVIFVQLNAGVVFDVNLLMDDPNSLLAKIKTQSEQIKAADPDAPYVTNAEFRELPTADATDPYALVLTIANYPVQVATLDTKPWTITRTYTIFNPISLLPADDNFTYYTGLTSERRHSSTNTTLIAQEDDGTYVYLWSSTDAMTVTDVYPNRPLYYIIALGVAAGVGVIIFVIARYLSCKKRRQPL